MVRSQYWFNQARQPLRLLPCLQPPAQAIMAGMC